MTESFHLLTPQLRSEDLMTIKQEAQRRAVGKFYERFYTSCLYNSLELIGDNNVQQVISQDLSTLNVWEGRGTPFGYFITISPKNLAKDVVSKLLGKVLAKRWIVDYVASIEKASQWHIHLYVRANGKAMSQVRNEVKNTCAKFQTNIDYKRINRCDEQKVVAYVKKDGDYRSGGHFQELEPITVKQAKIVFID